MVTKLTLTVEKEVIERAKSYARQTGRSLSELVEMYLENITDDSTGAKPFQKLKSITGAVKLPKDFNERKQA